MPLRPRPASRRGEPARTAHEQQQCQRDVQQVPDEAVEERRLAGQRRVVDGARHPADRKSVVKGKSGSVGVDLGGSRIIKQKKNSEYKIVSYLYDSNVALTLFT